MSLLPQTVKLYWNKAWFRRSAKTLLALLVVLMSIPYVLEFAISHQLRKLGAETVSIDDIDLNPFAGSLKLKQFSMTAADQAPAQLGLLEVDVRMLALFKGKVVIERLLISAIDADISKRKNGVTVVNGLALPVGQGDEQSKPADTQATASLQWGLVSAEIIKSKLNYSESEFNQSIIINSIRLAELESWEANNSANLEIDLLLDKAPVKLAADLELFSENRRFSGDVKIDSLTLAPYHKFYQDYLSLLDAAINLQGKFDVTIGPQIEAQFDSNLSVDNLVLVYQDINQTARQFTWKGIVNYSASSGPTAAGDVHISNSMTRDNNEQYIVSSFDSLDLTEFSYDSNALKISELSLAKLALVDTSTGEPENIDRLAQLGKLTLKQLGLELAAPSLNLTSVELAHPVAAIQIDKDGQISALSMLQRTIGKLSTKPDKGPSSDVNEVEKPAQNQAGLTINIESLKLTEPGSILLDDTSVSPPYKPTIHLNKIAVNQISSVKPATFEVGVKLGDYTEIDISGEGLLLDPRSNLNATATIKQLDLPPVTPYTSKAMGYGMKSGVVDSEIDLSLQDHQIDSTIKLKIDSIEVVETSKETAEEISSASGMSIDLAVSSLKDSNNVIDLTLPIQGNIDNPDFDLSLVINKAMGKAMKAATLTYLQHSLQPFGSLVTLFSLAKAAANHINLPPVAFSANSSELDSAQKELLDKVVKVLRDRPALKIKACGVSSPIDITAIETRLIEIEKQKLSQQNKPLDKIILETSTIRNFAKELADQRAAAVKAYLITSGEIESGRILNCLSEVNTEDSAKPYVTLQI